MSAAEHAATDAASVDTLAQEMRRFLELGAVQLDAAIKEADGRQRPRSADAGCRRGAMVEPFAGELLPASRHRSSSRASRAASSPAGARRIRRRPSRRCSFTTDWRSD